MRVQPWIAGSVLALVLVACAAGAGGQGLGSNLPFSSSHPQPSPSPTSAIPPAPPATITPRPSPTPTPTAPGLWLDPGVPTYVQVAVESLFGQGFSPAPTAAAARARIRLGSGEALLATWVYVPVVPFSTLADDIAWADIQRFWAGDPAALKTLTDDGSIPALFLAPDTQRVLTALLGEPAPTAPVRVVPADELVNHTWAARPSAWAIVPFDALEPRWKVLTLDGLSALSPGLDLGHYPLAVTVSVQGDAQVVAQLRAALNPEGRALTNRDPGQMTVLTMTGVTALVRATAWKMEQRGLLYPSAQVRDLLTAGDLLHISNEVAFAEDCPFPNPNQEDTRFCSSPRYIQLLEDLGNPIIELTGNHWLDWGIPAANYTLDLYRQRGWAYFGGGRDLKEAGQPLLITHNGNRLAFLGCNLAGPPYDWATETSPGSLPCDLEALSAQIRQLRESGALPIVTWQYIESYSYEPLPQQVADFRAAAEAGAVIVSGSQAHQPQSMEFYHDSFIHYGLGNLFFDQMNDLGTRQEFVDRHIFYQGRHISTQLLTFLLEDYAQPRPMTPAERRQFLQTIFEASGW